jgi:hypothetical protein
VERMVRGGGGTKGYRSEADGNLPGRPSLNTYMVNPNEKVPISVWGVNFFQLAYSPNIFL